ncbi:hypothetical protein [Treponema sp.]|uniref:hypothetical protein n=1 Tax=Treponema sp. TaxID=166 RepID=UPI0025E0051E|nr:hypothetical protein [Treponema sp.]MBR4323308.1 hypothetical protein [Treponema sp.]
MKSTFKFKSLFILLLAFAVSFVFVSCKDDSDDNSSQTPELRATYAATGNDGTYTICAGLNGKYEMYLSNASYGTILVSKGTYTIDSGDETNGTLSITTTGEMKNGSWVTVANPTPMSISVTNGQFTMKIGGNNYSFSKK